MYSTSAMRLEDLPKRVFTFVLSTTWRPSSSRKLCTLREESSQTNSILQYKLLASILSAVCSVIQQS